jgi:hypothetical protein
MTTEQKEKIRIELNKIGVYLQSIYQVNNKYISILKKEKPFIYQAIKYN